LPLFAGDFREAVWIGLGPTSPLPEVVHAVVVIVDEAAEEESGNFVVG
jgi:hypothetical protein